MDTPSGNVNNCPMLQVILSLEYLYFGDVKFGQSHKAAKACIVRQKKFRLLDYRATTGITPTGAITWYP
jgi:hypothetical protein